MDRAPSLLTDGRRRNPASRSASRSPSARHPDAGRRWGQERKRRRLFLSRRPQILAGGEKCAGELAAHRLEQRARGIAHFLLDVGVGIELGMAGGVWLPIADVAVELGG